MPARQGHDFWLNGQSFLQPRNFRDLFKNSVKISIWEFSSKDQVNSESSNTTQKKDPNNTKVNNI
jgi:hypothetical protein